MLRVSLSTAEYLGRAGCAIQVGPEAVLTAAHLPDVFSFHNEKPLLIRRVLRWGVGDSQGSAFGPEWHQDTLRGLYG